MKYESKGNGKSVYNVNEGLIEIMIAMTIIKVVPVSIEYITAGPRYIRTALISFVACDIMLPVELF